MEILPNPLKRNIWAAMADQEKKKKGQADFRCLICWFVFPAGHDFQTLT